MIKQVIIVRKDLKMRKGKMIAQGCHASLAIFFKLMFRPIPLLRMFCLFMTKEMYEWKQGVFTKICVSVDSEEELLEINKKAVDAGLPVALIRDAGKTEFNGVATYTCLAIGPAKSKEIDKITGGLKLL